MRALIVISALLAGLLACIHLIRAFTNDTLSAAFLGLILLVTVLGLLPVPAADGRHMRRRSSKAPN
jgi:hypothetical protein